ncbi:MAG: hypothetical protein NTX44_05125 [Ignavibacteriales bacterium]|nr:hypothetical protein [Ignavibacteriales bacterium]
MPQLQFTYDQLESLLIQPGDLPVGFAGGQIRDEVPAMFSELPKPEVSIYQQLAFKGEIAGGIALFICSDNDTAKKSFSIIVSGFGQSEEDDLYKRSVESVKTIGEQCAQVISHALTPELLGVPLNDNGDLAFVRKSIVVHIRMVGTSDSIDLQTYAKRLDQRICK